MSKERGNSFAKTLDRKLGPILLRLISLFRRRRSIPTSPKRIGVLITAAIGDTLLGSSIGRSLQAKFPNSEVILMTGQSNSGIGKMLEGFSQVHILPVYRPWRAILQLRDLKLDVLIDTGQWASINAIYTALSDAKFTVGFQTRGYQRHLVYDVAILHSNQKHELENFQSLLTPLGTQKLPPLLKAHPAELVEANLIVCHLKPSGEKTYLKEWPEDNWLTLINWFCAQGKRVYLSGGPEDLKYLQAFRHRLQKPEVVDIGAGRDRLSDTLQVLERASLVVSVNTGIMHLASLLDRPLIALHGPTNPKRWGPLSKNAVVIASALPCAPCLNLGFDYGCDEPKCMRSLSVESVKSAALGALAIVNAK